MVCGRKLCGVSVAEGVWRARCLRAAVVIAVAVSGYAYGAMSQRFEIFPYHYVGWLLRGDAIAEIASRGGYDVTAGRRVVSCRELAPNALVLVTLGQSNAANSGTERFGPEAGVYNFNFLDGRCYRARDPLLGAGGRGGSVWIPLAREIVDSGLAASVIVAPIGLGGTRVDDWAPGGSMAGRFERLRNALSLADLHMQAILWHQGESDHATDPDSYVASFLAIVRVLRESGAYAPIYVARATRCGDVVSAGIRRAQSQLGTDYRALGLRPGPDTDVIAGPAWRDGCHFTRAGLVRHAGLWFEAIAGELPGLLARPAGESSVGQGSAKS